MSITIDKETGMVTWGGYTISPTDTEIAFKLRIDSAPLAQGQKPGLEPTPARQQSEQSGFFSRLLGRRQQGITARNENIYTLPIETWNDISATGRLVFTNGELARLEISFNLVGRSEADRLVTYNRFFTAELGVGAATSFPDWLNKPLEMHFSWGIARSYFSSKPQAGQALCEIRYKSPAEKAAIASRNAPKALPSEIPQLVKAYQTYVQAQNDEASHQRFRRLLAQTIASPPSDFAAWSRSGLVPTQDMKRLALLGDMAAFLSAAQEQGQYADAVAAASILIMLEPSDHPQYAKRAEAYVGLKDYDNAVQSYTEALDHAPDQAPLAPENPASRFQIHWAARYLARRGELRRRQRDFAGALDDLTRSLSLKVVPETFFFRGITNMAQSNFRQALGDFEQGAALAPEEAALQINLALCQMHLGDTDTALTALTGLIETMPNNPSVLTNLAWVYLWRSDNQSALLYAQQALAIDDQNWFAHYVRGMVRVVEADAAGAAADFRRAIDLCDNREEPLYAHEIREMQDYLARHGTEQ